MCTLFTNCLWVDRQAQIANPNWSLLLQIQIWNLDPSTNCSQKRNLIWRVALPSLFKRHPLYFSDPVQKAAKWQSFHKGKTLIFPNCPPYGPYIDALQTAVNTCLFFIRRCHDIAPSPSLCSVLHPCHVKQLFYPLLSPDPNILFYELLSPLSLSFSLVVI